MSASKREQYLRQSETARREIATWPEWMQRNLTPRLRKDDLAARVLAMLFGLVDDETFEAVARAFAESAAAQDKT